MTVLDRAYSFLEIRAVDDGRRIFKGVATTPEMDRMGDTLDSTGAQYAEQVTLLSQHDHRAPIGVVRLKKATKNGIEFEAEIPVVEEPGPLKDRVDTAWGELRYGIVRAVSIGFRPIEYSFTKTGVHFQKFEIIELSTVSVPANASAIVTAVKAFDREARAAAGVPEPLAPVPTRSDSDVIPAAPGKRDHVVKLTEPARSRAPFVIKRIVHTR